VGLRAVRDEEVAWENAAPVEDASYLNCVQPASKLCKNHVLDVELAGVELSNLWCNVHSLQMHF